MVKPPLKKETPVTCFESSFHKGNTHLLEQRLQNQIKTSQGMIRHEFTKCNILKGHATHFQVTSGPGRYE